MAVLGALTLMLATPARGQWRIGGFVGAEHESSWDEFLVIGAEARSALGSSGLEVNPRFAYFVRSSTTRFQIDANLIKPLVLATPYRVEPFVGVGLALERVSYDGAQDASQTSVGFNYIVGGTLRTSGRLKPFAQFEYTVLNDSPNNAVVSVGLHFALGSAAQPAARPAPTRPARR